MALSWQVAQFCCLIFAVFSVSCGQEKKVVSFESIERVRYGGFSEFVKKPTVTAVYFMLKEPGQVQNFLEQLNKAGSLLKAYGVSIGMVNCQLKEFQEIGYCQRKKVDHGIFAFRDGIEMLNLALENMFDVNSIMSNILQLVLLKEVPIVQDREEVLDLLDRHKGKRDVFFSFQKAIGTYEHKSLMEVAFAFQSHYKFAISTDVPAVKDLIGYDEKATCQIWVFLCRDVAPDAPCGQILYSDQMDLVALTRYAKAMLVPNVHDVSVDGDENPFSRLGIHIATLFYDERSAATVQQVATTEALRFRGLVGFLLVNTEKENAKKHGHLSQLKTPRLSLALRTGETVLMEAEMSGRTVDRFICAELGLKSEEQVRKVSDPFQKRIPTEEEQLVMVEEQDDQVAEAVHRLRNVPIKRDHVLTLTDRTFPTETRDRDLLIVLFYLKFDAVSMAFLRSFADAASQLARDGVTPLATVDCFDWTDVCGANNVTAYPTVRVYRKGREWTAYSGMLDTGSVVSTAKLLLADELTYLATDADAQRFVDGELPEGIGAATDVAVLGLFTAETNTDLRAFREAAAMLHGKLQFGYTSEQVTLNMLQRYGTKAPAVVVVKRHDALQPFAVVSRTTNATKLAREVSRAAHPIFVELTVHNFPALFAMKKAFTILFDENVREGTGAHKVLQDVVMSGAVKNNIFCWMDLTNGEGIAGKILLEYNSGAEPPALAHVNHRKGAIYNYNQGELRPKLVREWLEAIELGTMPPSKTLREGDWKPLNPGYDFLRMMEKDEERAQRKHDDAASGADGTGTPVPQSFTKALDIDVQKEQEAREELLRVRGEARSQPGGDTGDQAGPGSFHRSAQQHTEL